MTNQITRLCVGGIYPLIICGGVVVGVVRLAGNLGINDGEIKIYLLDTHARATPPPRHMLAKPRQILPCLGYRYD